MRVDQQFVQVGERRVFVHHAGRGPAVVLLHQSPQNGRAMRPWIERLASRFAVFAPDAPGLGLSDPLPRAQPTIPDLARATVALLDALGLERVLLVGVHTGAVIAARVALERPDRVAAVACDGLALFDADERRELLDGYLPPFEPSWDGAHLTWLWARLREQTLFFPWQAKDRGHRLAYPLADVAKTHRDVMDVLDAGDGYRAVYRAPFLYEQGRETAAALRVPAALLYRDTDVLAPHAGRLPSLSPCVELLRLPAEDADTAVEALLNTHAATAQTVDSGARVASAASPTRRVAAVDGGSLGLHIEAGDGTVGDLLLPDIGTPVTVLPHGLAGGPRVAVELPGHGAAGGWAEAPTLDRVAGALCAAVNALGGTHWRLQAWGGSAAFAFATARRLGPRCESVTLHDMPRLDSAERAHFLQGLPILQPQPEGAHLLQAWQWARLRRLFRAGAVPSAESALPVAAPPPWRVHGDVVEMLRAGPQFAALWREALASDFTMLVHDAGAPVTGWDAA